MAYSETIAARLRRALSATPNVTEKKMFGSLAFLVSGKLCITAGPDRIMCRINPLLHDDLVKRRGCHSVIMKGRVLEGYVHVEARHIEKEDDLHYWVALTLDYDQHVASPARKCT